MSHLLGGRIWHDQPPDGHRSGIEPVLLAASVPARPGQSVLEAGTGSGTALLCLAARVAGITGLGLELEPARAACAGDNFVRNGFDRLRVEVADLTTWRGSDMFDHAMANPPWHNSAATASPDPSQDVARRRSGDGVLAAWAGCLGRRLRHHGTLTLIVAAAVMPEAMSALTEAGCGNVTLLPLWARENQPAKLILLQGRRLGRGPARVLPGLVLHDADGRFTDAAEAVLREGAGLTL